MKTVQYIFLLLLGFSLCGSMANAKVCDEVLYVAYRGGIFGNPRIAPLQIESIPHYFGAFCIDSTEKKLTFYPHTENRFFLDVARKAVNHVNKYDFPFSKEITMGLKEEYRTKGEGWVDEKKQKFHAPKNTALFPYWVGEYVNQRVGKVFRRDVNAEPELDWEPNFTDAIPFVGCLFADDEWPKSFKWTDSKGRSGP